VDKPVVKKTIVVYSGRFQPFHKGHYAAYEKLVSKFGANNVYIGTSDKSDGGKSPFNFKEKVVIMGKMFGIPPSKIVQVANPYSPKEILSKFDGQTTAYIAAVGEKDATRLAGKYFKPYKGKTGYGYDEIGYTYIIPPESNPISGTDVRNWLSSDKAEKLFLKAYPKFDKEIYKMITNKLIKEEFIKGYPSKEDVKRIQKKNDDIRSVATTDDSYVYDPIAEQIAKLVFEADNFIEEYFLEEEPNPIMDKEISYTAADGKKKKITVRGALRLPKDHEAHIQASKIVGPNDAPANEPKKKEEPNQPGQPVKKGDTEQGKSDNKPADGGTQQGPPPEQKLKGSELKSSAEDRVAKERKAQEVKDALDNEIKNLNKEEQDFLDKGEHKQGSKFMNSLKDGIKRVADTKVVKAIGHTLQHKAEMVSGAFDGVKALASGQKIGSTKNKETGEWEYSDETRKKQIHHMKHFAKDVALLVGSVALGSGLAYGAKALAGGSSLGGAIAAAGKGAVGAFTHGVGGFAAHLGKDAIKHVALESMGMGGTQAAVGGAGLAGATMGLLEIRSLINEEEMNNNKFIQNFINKMAEKMETFEMSDEQLLQSIKSYKQGKNFGDLVKEDVNVDVDKGDEVLMGKFKNKKVTVKDIGKDQHGMPTINGKQATTFRISNQNIKEKLSHSNLNSVEKYADRELSPADIEFSNHFFDRVNDTRNGKEISEPELTGFFKRLARHKKEFLDFLDKYNQIVVRDTRSDINIPFVKMANKVIAKTVMRKDDFKTSSHTIVNEITKGFFKGKIKIGGQPVDVEVELVGADNKNRDFLTKVIGIDKKYQSKLPIGSTLPIPSRIFRHGGWVKVKVPSVFNEVHQSTTYRADKDAEMDFMKHHKTSLGAPDMGYEAELDTYDNDDNRKLVPGYQVNRNDKEDFGYEKVKDVDESKILKEEIPTTTEKKSKGRIIGEFIMFAYERLGLKDVPSNIKLVRDNEFATTFKSFGGYDPHSDDIYVYVSNRSLPDILRTLAHELIHLKQRQSGYIGGVKDGETGSDVENEANAAAGILLRDFGKRNGHIYESINESLLLEGGAYGHMNHPFDISMNLTFGDLKKIINNALDGKLGVVREKTDGQALAISWKNGRLVAARNKSHLANSGANALDMSGLASKFGGRGALSDAYNFAMRDLSTAISGLGEKERQSIFKDGSAFCNLEVIYPQNANVIPYGQSLLVFHNVVEYDEKGNAIGVIKGAESKLASMIKNVNAHVQSKYTLQGPPITKLPKDEKLSSQKGKFNAMLSKLQSEFGLSDKDGIAEYHFAWWMKFVDNSKKNLSQLEKEGLARRWAFDNKSFGIKSIVDEEAKKWADGVDKDAKDKIMKGNIRKFEDIFLGVGAEVLSFMSSVLTAQPDKALQSIKASLESSISDIRNGGSEAQIKRLEKELARLNAIGGFEKLVPNEGLVFFYKGNTYKLTGTFAPLNQILGIFKFGR